MPEVTPNQLIGMAIRAEIAKRFARGPQTVAGLAFELREKGRSIALHLHKMEKMGLIRRTGKYHGRQEIWEKVPVNDL